MSEQATYSTPVVVITPAEPIRFSVPGLPIAQPRQRHRVIQTNGRAFATNYTPAKAPVNAWKATVALFARQAYQGPLLTGPLALTISFDFLLPTAAKKAVRQAVTTSSRVVYHTSKPEIDNMVKALQDALNKVVWVDDRQIAELHCVKRYAVESGVQVEIRAR